MLHRLRILHLSDLHERVALDWMDEERKAKIHANAGNRHRVLGHGPFKAAARVQISLGTPFFCPPDCDLITARPNVNRSPTRITRTSAEIGG